MWTMILFSRLCGTLKLSPQCVLIYNALLFTLIMTGVICGFDVSTVMPNLKLCFFHFLFILVYPKPDYVLYPKSE